MRSEIVAAALESFHTQGYSAGVKEITDAAGVPKGSFYNHFGSKEQMAVEALAQYAATLGLAELADESVPPLSRLRAHFDLLAEQVSERGYTGGCMLGNFAAEAADHSTLIRGAVGAGYDRWAELITAAISRAQRDGTVASELDPVATGRFLMNAWEGALLGARAARTEDSLTAFFATVFDVLLRPAVDRKPR